MESPQKNRVGFFQMPLHYPRYTQKDYEDMPEWKLDGLLKEYGLPTHGDLAYKRELAMGTFIWPKCHLDSNS
ncbi:S-adenosyl-L-methionine-dependent methyltransferase [Senna tora]|uniref:S-adenosyl-L-methionine-dependent methyltransferase n=1 Tax=Senna tora TaxID=362788 RepID=A0A834WEI6_9FABA|nr:S-adenosyl-L-methionine-dependent methyltransferase [Senna tora]